MHKSLTWKTAAGVLFFALAVLLAVPNADAQKKGKSRPAETKYLMKGIVQANCAALGGLLKDKGPADDKAWGQVAVHAAVLNEMGYVLMDDGRCPSGDWAGATKTLKECSAKVAEAAEGKKLEDAQGAFKALTGACSACHKAHRQKAK